MGQYTSYVNTAMQVGGTLMSAKGQRDSGAAAAQQAKLTAANETAAAEFEARQAEQLAYQATATGQRNALEERRAAALLKSRALAVAAAGGAGVSDLTVVDILNNIRAEGAYSSAVAMYEGEDRARSLRNTAVARRLSGESAAEAALYEGASQQSASKTRSYATLLQGASSILSSYGSLSK